MIIFEGIKFKNKVTYICFSSNGKTVEIPIEKPIADRITKYLDKISLPINNI